MTRLIRDHVVDQFKQFIHVDFVATILMIIDWARR